MRYKEISGKEIVNIRTGTRLGILGQSDLQIDEKTGKIESFLIPSYTWFGMKRKNDAMLIPWDVVKKIGDDFILIDWDEQREHE